MPSVTVTIGALVACFSPGLSNCSGFFFLNQIADFRCLESTYTNLLVASASVASRDKTTVFSEPSMTKSSGANHGATQSATHRIRSHNGVDTSRPELRFVSAACNLLLPAPRPPETRRSKSTDTTWFPRTRRLQSLRTTPRISGQSTLSLSVLRSGRFMKILAGGMSPKTSASATEPRPARRPVANSLTFGGPEFRQAPETHAPIRDLANGSPQLRAPRDHDSQCCLVRECHVENTALGVGAGDCDFFCHYVLPRLRASRVVRPVLCRAGRHAIFASTSRSSSLLSTGDRNLPRLLAAQLDRFALIGLDCSESPTAAASSEPLASRR